MLTLTDDASSYLPSKRERSFSSSTAERMEERDSKLSERKERASLESELRRKSERSFKLISYNFLFRLKVLENLI